MNKKKAIMSAAALMAIGAGVVMYFKKNPGKFEAMKHRMLAADYDFEDEMM